MAIHGMNRHTGKAIAGREHLIQSLTILLTTPIGSRVMLPEYGSELSNLLDEPITPTTRLQINKTIFDAIARWEPRFKLRQVQSISRDVDGQLTLTLVGSFEGQDITLTDMQPFAPVVPPETPIVPPPDTIDPNFHSFMFGNNRVFLFGNNRIIGYNVP